MESWPKKSGIVFWTSQDVKLQCKKIFFGSFFYCVLLHVTVTFLRKEVSDFFDEKDRDYDGCLSFGEFMGEETPLEKVFKNMDKDGDGSITKQVWNELNPWSLEPYYHSRSFSLLQSTSHQSRLRRDSPNLTQAEITSMLNIMYKKHYKVQMRAMRQNRRLAF